MVRFDKPIKTASLSMRVSLYTVGKSMGIRVGLDADNGFSDPQSPTIQWGGWEGPDNGWKGEPKTLRLSWLGQADRLTVFLEAEAKWPIKHTCRFRDVQLEVEYLDTEPDPEPDPDPEPEPGIPGQIAQVLAEITERLEQVSDLLGQWNNKGQAWVDEYNERLEV